MFIDIHDLERQALEFQEEIRPESLDLGPDMRQVNVLKTTGRADLVQEHHGKHHIIQDIRLKGGLWTRLQMNCARCLEPVMQDVARDFDLLYRPLGSDAGHAELSVTDVEAEIGYYTGNGLELGDVLREQILLAVPLRVLCKEECRGLCPHCGKNLNEGQCSCAEPLEDPRWAALKDIRKRLE